MARSPRHVPSLPSGWGMLLAAWERGEDIRPLMGHLEWDVPVLVRGDQDDSQNVSLVHPLVHALKVKPAGFSQALVEALVDHPWGPTTFTQKQGAHSQVLPALENFYEWKVLDAVVKNRAFKVLPFVAEGLARSVNAFRHSSSAMNELSRMMVRNLPQRDVVAVVGVLDPHFKAQPNLVSLVCHAFPEACLVGKGELALELRQAHPKTCLVFAGDIKNLAGHGQFEAAKKLMGELDLPRSVFLEAERSRTQQEAAGDLMATLNYAVRVVHEASKSDTPTPKLKSRAEAAYDLASALLDQFKYPVATQRRAGSEACETLALALTHLPHRFPSLAKDPTISADVLQAWLMMEPTDCPLLGRGLALYAELAGQDALDKVICKVVEAKAENIGIFRQVPMAKKVERMERLYDVLEKMAAHTGIPAQEMAKSHVPSGLTQGGYALHWSRVVTSRFAAGLDMALEPGVADASRPRL